MTATPRRWAGVRRLVTPAVAAVVAAGCGGEPGAFSPRGDDAAQINWLFWFMVATGGLVFVTVLVLLGAAARGRAGDAPGRSRWLVLGGGVALPVVVLVPLTVMMVVVGDRIAPPRGDALEVQVIGHQYWWEVVYPDGTVTANEIHIPAGEEVQLLLETADVIHSVWVPQLAGKIDMIPGEVTQLTIAADEPGEYLGQCAEFCGTQHARMRFEVIAHPAEEFDRWLADESADAAVSADGVATEGAEVFEDVGCAACHTIRGTDADGDVGPDLTHLASRRTIAAGTLPNERGHLGGWISDPQATKPGNHMPATPLTADELLALLDYLESLE